MKDVHLTASALVKFKQALQEAEKSVATIEKYLRDLQRFGNLLVLHWAQKQPQNQRCELNMHVRLRYGTGSFLQ